MNMSSNRPEETIKKILQDYFNHDYDITEFCYFNEITEATLQQWIQQYPQDKAAGSEPFLEIVPTEERKSPGRPKRQQAIETGILFARVGDIELYQQVPAAYLKSLKS